jgi:hypothetical protein
MKRLFFLQTMVSLLWVCAAFAQTPGQFYITSYERKEPFYFCGSDPILGGQNIHYGVLNFNYKGRGYADSLRYEGDSSIFRHSMWEQRDSVDFGEASISSTYYVPKKIGSDTLRIVLYYGPYKSVGTIICHAKPSPPIGFYGVTTVLNDVGGGNYIGGSDEVLTIDTLHDDFAYGPYSVSDTPQRAGFTTAIYAYVCGDVTIDSIYTVGNFSELEIQNIPALPVTLHSGDSLVMPYIFTPKVPGTHPHYLVLHTTTGEYLVWSFEYTVLPTNSVGYVRGETHGVRLFPNPGNGDAKIIFDEPRDIQSVQVFSASGNLVKTFSFESLNFKTQSVSISISDIPSGVYHIRVSTGKLSYLIQYVKL